MSESTPIIYVSRDPRTGFCKFWCTYCNQLHRHGQGDGHRSAHCISKDSPYHQTGYTLKTRFGDGLSEIESYEYTINLYLFNDRTHRSIRINKNELNFDKDVVTDLLKYYEDRDYYNTTLCALRAMNIINDSNKDFILTDLQSEGDGTPDFMFRHPTVVSFDDFYIEFKSESDTLRLNQLYKFNYLTERFKVYLLHIDKRKYNGK